MGQDVIITAEFATMVHHEAQPKKQNTVQKDQLSMSLTRYYAPGLFHTSLHVSLHESTESILGYLDKKL